MAGTNQRERLRTAHPRAALGLAAGPVAFISAWAVGGARMPDYSPVTDAISRIAAVGSPERALMTAGFVVYGGSMLIGSTALRRSNLTGTWGLAAANGLATLAVAATPLDWSASVDLAHGVAATVGYASISALPIAASKPLRQLGHRRAATASIAVGAISAACLVATTFSDSKGLFQRAGLGAGDVWLVAAGIALWQAGRHAPVRADDSGTSLSSTL